MKIADFKDIDTAARAVKMFELRKQISIFCLDGKFREARKLQKELAHEAINDFETYKQLPLLQIRANKITVKESLSLLFLSLKNKLFYKFSKKTPEEKQLNKMCKEYFGSLTQEEIKAKTIDYTIPSLF